MDWIKLIYQNPSKALTLPVVIGLVQFIAHVIVALSDGQIDSSEFHALMSSASGLETILLGIVMVVLNKQKKGNK
jgi:hypothetical protein